MDAAEGESLRQVMVGRSGGCVPIAPAAYAVTGRSFGVDSQGRVYQDSQRYSAAPEQAAELTALLELICS